MTCIHCHDGTLKHAKSDLRSKVKGKDVLIPGFDALVCEHCGYKTVEGSAMPEFMRAAADVYRTKYGLLTSDDIRNRRTQMGLTQRQFAAYLPTGIASVKRWEMGQVQDKAMDELIRIKTDCDEAAKNLAEHWLAIAESIARKAHTGQTEESTGDDYIRHIERVVALVHSEHAKAVAWLHDVLEDSAVTPFDLNQEEIPEEIIDAVLLVTRRKHDDYAVYIQRLKDSGNALALAVKIADLRDHFRPNCPARLRPRYEKAWLALTGGSYTHGA